jgi:hypothetical protein
MANYLGQGRTNYFRVKDPEAFTNEFASYDVEIITSVGDGETLYGFLDNSLDGGGFSWSLYDDETEEFTDIDYLDAVSKHLADGEVCVLIEVGWEKYRYLNGIARAVNSKGEQREVSLTDIYKQAEELGSNITQAFY